MKDFDFKATDVVKRELSDKLKACVWDSCLSWKQAIDIMSGLQKAYENDQLGPMMIALLGSAITYLGTIGGNLKMRFEVTKQPAIVWPEISLAIAMLVGSLAGLYAGLETIKTAVKTSYYDSNRPGSSYVLYGGNSTIGNLLGLFETIWVAAWLVLAAVIVYMPF